MFARSQRMLATAVQARSCPAPGPQLCVGEQSAPSRVTEHASDRRPTDDDDLALVVCILCRRQRENADGGPSRRRVRLCAVSRIQHIVSAAGTVSAQHTHHQRSVHIIRAA